MIVPFEISKNGSISPGAKAVYIAIKSYYPRAHPSLETIMENTGMSRRSVIRKIKELEKIKAIIVARRKGDKNYYVVSLKPGDRGNYDLIGDIQEKRVPIKAVIPSKTGAKNDIPLVPLELLIPVPKELL